eukprot:s26_g33.t1
MELWGGCQANPDRILLFKRPCHNNQCFPNPTVENLLQASQAVRRARQHSDLEIRVPYITPQELTISFWSDAAFANALNRKTQGGWLMALTSHKFAAGLDSPVSFVGWKSYKLPRVVSSTLAGEAQCFSSASGIAEWCMLILSEALDGPFSRHDVDEILQRRSPIGMTDCQSLYDDLITLGSGGTLDDKRVAIDVAVIRQSIRSRLQPRWVPTDRMVADGLTKDKGEPLDLLRSVFRSARYQLADEQLVGPGRFSVFILGHAIAQRTSDPQEVKMVREILARMEAQGTPISPDMWSVTRSGAMADSSKRQRDPADFPSSDDESLLGKGSGRGSDGFELIREDAQHAEPCAQKPLKPKIKPSTMPELPEGVESVEKWDMTVCSLPKVKEQVPTYHEIGTLAKFHDFRT